MAPPTELLTARLRNQRLIGSTQRTPAQVVSRLCAMQVQDYSGAKWAIGLRLPAELAKRYFASHGPATVRDFSWWSGLTLTEAQQAIDSVRPALQSSTVAGLPCFSAKAPEGPSIQSGMAFLLPNYDEYLIAYKDRAPLVDASRAANIAARTGGALANHLIIDGRLAGGWSRRLNGNAVVIEVAPYKKLTPAQTRAAANAAEAYGEFVGLPASLSVV